MGSGKSIFLVYCCIFSILSNNFNSFFSYVEVRELDERRWRLIRRKEHKRGGGGDKEEERGGKERYED